MDKLSQYYVDILKRIDELIADQKYEDALEIINQEISAPYIPSEYQNRFEKLYLKINQTVTIQRIEHKYNKMNKMEMLAQVYNGKKLDLNVLSFFLGKFHKNLDIVDLQYLNKVFQDKDISNDEKIFALEQIKLTGVEYTFEYTNSVFHNKFKINSQSDFEFDKSPYFQNVLKKINNLLFKNPSQITMCREVLLIIYEYYFNGFPNYDVDFLAYNIVDYVDANFEQKKIVDSQFKEWLDNIMNGKKVLN